MLGISSYRRKHGWLANMLMKESSKEPRLLANFQWSGVFHTVDGCKILHHHGWLKPSISIYIYIYVYIAIYIYDICIIHISYIYIYTSLAVSEDVHAKTETKGTNDFRHWRCLKHPIRIISPSGCPSPHLSRSLRMRPQSGTLAAKLCLVAIIQSTWQLSRAQQVDRRNTTALWRFKPSSI